MLHMAFHPSNQLMFKIPLTSQNKTKELFIELSHFTPWFIGQFNQPWHDPHSAPLWSIGSGRKCLLKWSTSGRKSNLWLPAKMLAFVNLQIEHILFVLQQSCPCYTFAAFLFFFSFLFCFNSSFEVIHLLCLHHCSFLVFIYYLVFYFFLVSFSSLSPETSSTSIVLFVFLFSLLLLLFFSFYFPVFFIIVQTVFILPILSPNCFISLFVFLRPGAVAEWLASSAPNLWTRVQSPVPPC